MTMTLSMRTAIEKTLKTKGISMKKESDTLTYLCQIDDLLSKPYKFDESHKCIVEDLIASDCIPKKMMKNIIFKLFHQLGFEVIYLQSNLKDKK